MIKWFENIKVLKLDLVLNFIEYENKNSGKKIYPNVKFVY